VLLFRLVVSIPLQYLVVNSDLVRNAATLMSEPGVVVKMVKHFRHNATNPATSDEEAEAKRLSLPKSPSTWFKHFQASNCITFGRVLVSNDIVWHLISLVKLQSMLMF